MITKMMSGLLTPSFSVIDRAKEQSFWRQCRRAYKFQPIYLTSGHMMGLELLTAVSHPAEPAKFQSPERYFAAISVPRRLTIIQEQLDLLERWRPQLEQHGLLASINVDGQSLEAIQQDQALCARIAAMPFARFELVEQAEMALTRPLGQIAQADRLWLDDFGNGLANFCSFTAWQYEYIKIARELFILLRQSDEGAKLFFTLVTLLNRYSKGVIIEGVETAEEWAMVCASDAYAAQGYYMSRPQTFDPKSGLPLFFAG
ncbi:cyclic-guanylate-specific phosphodiesterase [Nissabacter sp. SGAir0207]|nr:cyclic-guanylate-specific phosphodiesterase [Nissabacter sp. SGAir0207]